MKMPCLVEAPPDGDFPSPPDTALNLFLLELTWKLRAYPAIGEMKQRFPVVSLYGVQDKHNMAWIFLHLFIKHLRNNTCYEVQAGVKNFSGSTLRRP
jgi:hypothetical protein